MTTVGGSNRYCESCWAPLAEETNYCQNCGRAQHPLLAPSASTPPAQQSNMRTVVIGVVVIAVLMVLATACNSGTTKRSASTTENTTATSNDTTTNNDIASSKETAASNASTTPAAKSSGQSGKQHGQASRQRKKPTKQATSQQKAGTVGIGQPTSVGDSVWVVNSANRANQLNDRFGFGKPKQGTFVIADFTFTNNGKEPKTLSQPIINLIDSSGNKSSMDNDTFSYVPNEKQIFLDQVNPGVSKQGEAIFSVAPGSSGFKLELGDTSYFNTDKTYVDLGF